MKPKIIIAFLLSFTAALALFVGAVRSQVMEHRTATAVRPSESESEQPSPTSGRTRHSSDAWNWVGPLPDKPPTTEGRTPEHRLADLRQLLIDEREPATRALIAIKIAETGASDAASALLGIYANETDPTVRGVILYALSVAPAASVANELPRLRELLAAIDDTQDRIAIQDAIGNCETPEAIATLRSAFEDEKVDPLQRLNAAEHLLRIATREPGLFQENELVQLNARLQIEAQAASEPDIRSQAIMALAERREENREFLRGMLDREQDESVRQLLESLTS